MSLVRSKVNTYNIINIFGSDLYLNLLGKP